MKKNTPQFSVDLTTGSVLKTLIKFSLPFLLSCFLQTFYGLADLFITGLFYGADTISAVSIGSQLMHMLTVIIVGLAMGSAVSISRAVGLKDQKKIFKNIGNSITFFLIFSIIGTILLILGTDLFLKLLSTPHEAFDQAHTYSIICFAGVPFITAYNILSSIYRGLGDSKSPMYFILVAGIFNIILDFIFMGPLSMGAGGAALATVISQAISVVFAVVLLIYKNKSGTEESVQGQTFKKEDFYLQGDVISKILKIGVPIACQDGLIQISFLIITSIANSRGVEVAAAVGIVEKIICFLFLVPSAMLSSVSAISAQNAGAGKHNRAKKTLAYGIIITIISGTVFSIIGNICPEKIVGLFANNDSEVIKLGSQYFRSYVTDCIVAGIHFCFSGYFCAYGKSLYSFIHNILSITLIRIPGTYLASVMYPETLFPMGMAAPVGSLFSAILCTFLFLFMTRKQKITGELK